VDFTVTVTTSELTVTVVVDDVTVAVVVTVNVVTELNAVQKEYPLLFVRSVMSVRTLAEEQKPGILSCRASRGCHPPAGRVSDRPMNALRQVSNSQFQSNHFGGS
jgi:hypothetical protein